MERGKARDIHSLHYPERVIRRSVCINSLVPILSSNLIHDNGASLKGKGTKFTSSRTVKHLHDFYKETGSNEGYVLTVDFKGYFSNIQHQPLFNIIDRYILDERLNALSKSFIEATDWDKPIGERGKGLHIGPEDSQIFAVAFPNSIDHKIKDQWRIKQFDRYMDDSQLLFKSKDEAVYYFNLLKQEYVRIGIVTNPKKTQIAKLSKGFTFLKTRYFLTESGKVIGKPDRRAITRERRKLKKHRKKLDDGILTLEQISQSYMSWRGSMKHRDAHRSVVSMDGLFYNLFGATPWKKDKKRRKFTYGSNRK